MTVLLIAGVYVRRLVRDRTAMFFVVVLPVVVILVIGASSGHSGRFDVGIVDADHSVMSSGLVRSIRDSSAFTVTTYRSVGALKTAVRRQELQAGVDIAPGTGARLRAGKAVTIAIVGEQANTTTQAAYNALAAVVAAHGGQVQAALFATSEAGGSFDANLARAGTVAKHVPAVSVRDVQADARHRFLPQGYSSSAPTMLVLFVFINSLAVGAIAIENRRLGLYERFIAAPVRPFMIVLGEATGAFSIALLQSLLIIAVGAIGFGVHWSDPVAAAVLVVVWAIVGAAAGMTAGAFFRTPEQASAIGPALGIALGMLGGCMWPLEIVGPVMRTAGHLVPQAWAVDAWTELLSRGGALADIGRQLLVLSGFAAGLFVLASVRLRRALVH